MSLNRFDRIFYINLFHRKDRKEQIESQLKHLGVSKDKIIRIEACHNILNGHKGCAKSHIDALDLAIKYRLDNVLILEDDMVFSKVQSEVNDYIERFFTFIKNEWDVFFLATNVIEYEATSFDFIKRVKKSMCAHAYAINRSYFSKLRHCFAQAYEAMGDDEVFMDTEHKAIDKCWMSLQNFDRWYIGQTPLGYQAKSYSDIEHKVRDRRHQTYLK